MKNWREFCSRKTESNRKWLLVAGILLWCVAAMLCLCLGNIHFTPGQVLEILTGQAESGVNSSILWYARLPRTLAALLAGAALAASGAVLQNVLANKLASPGIIGVNAGAGLGVTICCGFGALSGWAVSGAAFAGSFLVVLLILLFFRRTGVSKTTVILCGVAMNSMLNAVNESITVLDPDIAALSTEFRVGGFSAISYARLIPAGVLIVLALILLFTLCNELDILTLGDETAQGIGLSVRRYRILFLMLAALLAGAAVSFAGLLGFIGLIIPHLIRKLVGNESRKLIPLCILFGGVFVALSDLAARLIFAPYELPVGIIMSVIGGPIFVILLIRHRGGRLND